MKVRGEDIASAVRDWLKEDIKGASAHRYDLGKFFVGLSTGTLSLFAALLKFATDHPTLNSSTLLCFFFLLASACIGLALAMPRVIRVGEKTELYDEYGQCVRTTIYLTAAWAVLWMIGFVLGVLELFD